MMRQFNAKAIIGLTTLLKELKKTDYKIELLNKKRNKLCSEISDKIEGTFHEIQDVVEFNRETNEVRYQTKDDIDEIEAAAEKIKTKPVAH